MLKFVIAVMLPVMAALNLFAQKIPDGRYGRLSNGLTYYIRKNNNPPEKIEMSLVVNAGWQHEDPDQLGLAHLLEHMAFNGTVHFPGDSMNVYAAKSDVILHAETGEYTVYNITLPLGSKPVYKTSLQILKDWATGITLDSIAIDAERGVVLSEFRSVTSEMKASADMNAILYDHAKYPQHFYENHDRSIKTFQHPSLIRFFKDWYRPDNQAIIIVGDINEDSIEKDIRDYFDTIKNPVNKRPQKDIRKEYIVHLSGKNKLVSRFSPEMSETNIEILWRREKENDLSEEEIELYNLMAIDRFQTITGPFHNLYHKIDKYGGDARSVLTQLEAVKTGIRFNRGQPVDKGIKIALQELERIKRYGFTEGEFTEAKSRLLSQLPKLDNSSSTAFSYKYVLHFVYQKPAADPAENLARQKNEIAGIKLSDINRMIKSWLGSNNNRHILITANTGDSLLIPDERLINSWIKESTLAKIAPYKYQPPLSQLIPEKDIPLIADSVVCGISDIAELGIRELTFENGVKVVLKPVYAIDKIYMNGFSVVDGSVPAGAIPPAFNNFDSFQVRKFLKQKEISFNFSADGKSVNLDVQTGSKNLESVLQLIYLYFTQAKHEAAASDSVYRRLFNNAGTFTFVITGNFDTEGISPLLFRYLCNLPGKIIKNDVVVSDIIPGADTINKIIYEGINATEANIKLSFSSAYPLSLANDIKLEFFEQALRIKMHDRLREKAGATYFVNTTLNKYKGQNNTFSYQVEFQCDPATSQKMTDMAFVEFEKLRSDGIDSTLFDLVRNQMLALSARNIASGNFWSQYLAYQYSHNLDRTEILKRESIIEYIMNLKDLNISLKELLKESAFHYFILLPKVFEGRL